MRRQALILVFAKAASSSVEDCRYAFSSRLAGAVRGVDLDAQICVDTLDRTLSVAARTTRLRRAVQPRVYSLAASGRGWQVATRASVA